MTRSPSSTSPLHRLALAATALTVAVVILGAYTRLVDAGLGCPDWPGCYGFLTVPSSPAEIATAEERFPHAPVEVHKAWPEVIHRYFAGALGLVIATLAVVAWRRRQEGAPLGLALGLLGLVIVQALFGMWTVTLKLWPQVVTAHLLGGFSTLSLLWLLSLRTSSWSSFWALPRPPRAPRLLRFALLCVVALVLQIALGGWVSSNYAALACPDFPTCQNQWWPTMNFDRGFNLLQHIGPNYLGGMLDSSARVAIHVSHRMGALVVTALVGTLAVRLLTTAGAPRLLRRLGGTVAFLLALQIGLGIGNVLLQLPLAVAVAHNAVAAFLLLALIAVCFCLWPTRPSTQRDH
ncbi:MAG: COX15/CtaA family protein [Pseudomonadota bacterium]|nr:COX15/CtaA family protein [Pseudomonadota bacterium]